MSSNERINTSSETEMVTDHDDPITDISKIEQITVNAVYPGDNTSKLFSHRVTVAEMDGRIYYLSNEISGDEEPDLWWHADRLSDGEWDEKI